LRAPAQLDRIRDAELPFADPVADDFDDEKVIGGTVRPV
jgi:hypothetical protein